MGIKIVIEPEESEDDCCVTCPKCGDECEADDNYCGDCGAKLPAQGPTAPATARLNSLSKAAKPSAMAEMD